MRSAWKLITGLVSRGNSEGRGELEDETSKIPHPGAKDVEAITLPDTEESELQDSPQLIEEASIEPSAAPFEGSVQRPEPQERIVSPSRLALANDAEPVLATTIRLVTKDRLSLRAELSHSTAVPNAPEANARNAISANTNGSGKSTEPATLFTSDASAATTPIAIGQKAGVERSRKVRSAQSASGVERPKVKRRSLPIAEIEIVQASPEAAVVSESIVLNSEINQLRQELAQKLRLQNDQLRRMLSRYDAG
jgi:hypothetical protein